MKLIFAGSPDFACPSLERLVNSHHTIAAVYTQPDRPAGRGRKLTPTAIKQLAQQYQLPICDPPSLKTNEAADALLALHADVMVVIAYGLLLPANILKIPRLGCVNLHPSLLPQWRGATPIQHTLLSGETTTGITIMQLDEGMDSGPILSQIPTAVLPTETAGELHLRLAHQGAEQLLETLNQLEQGSITPQPQDHQKATYTRKIQKADALIDWQQPAVELAHQVRAFNPWPIAYTHWQGHILRIWEAIAVDQYCDKPCGQLIAVSKDGIDINTGMGLLRVHTVQLPGKRPVDIQAFINAHQSDLISHHTYFGITAC